MTTTLEKLSAKIREGNPQLMELKEGCRVLTIRGVKVVSHASEDVIYYTDGSQKLRLRIDETEIIGCPIHLEHVMASLNKALKRYEAETSTSWGKEGILELEAYDCGAVCTKICSYDLSKDLPSRPQKPMRSY